jgi:predicted SAM-dependent methyltransferase
MKLNIGCGPYKDAGVINIDKNPVWEPDLVLDVRKGLPYEDNSVDGIKAWHFIEHLDKDEIVGFLAECYRVLKQKGKLDLLFPIGVTYDLDHKSYLSKYSFELICRGGKDDYYHGPKIAFTLIRAKEEEGNTQRLVLEVRK